MLIKYLILTVIGYYLFSTYFPYKKPTNNQSKQPEEPKNNSVGEYVDYEEVE